MRNLDMDVLYTLRKPLPPPSSALLASSPAFVPGSHGSRLDTLVAAASADTSLENFRYAQKLPWSDGADWLLYHARRGGGNTAVVSAAGHS